MKGNRRFPMAMKLAAASSALSLLTLAIVGLISYHRILTTSIEPMLGKRLDFIARSVALRLAGTDLSELVKLEKSLSSAGSGVPQSALNSSRFNDAVKILVVSKRQNELDRDLRVFVRDPDSPSRLRVLLSSNEEEAVFRSETSDPFFDSVFQEGLPLHTGIFERDGSEWVSGLAPIENSDGEVIGVLRANHRADDDKRVAAIGILKSIALAAIFAFAISSALAFAVSRWLALPLRKLSRAAQEIGRGDFATKIEISSRDEIGVLAKSLEAMRAELHASRDNMENYSRTLEQTVAWRTAELQETKETISAMIDALDEGFFLFDRTGICMPYFSRACFELLEQDPAGKSVESLLKLEPGSLRGWIDMAFSDQIPFDGITDLAPNSFAHSTGKSIRIRFRLTRDQDGKISHIVGIAKDMTEIVRAEKAAEAEREFSKLIVAIVENRERFSDFILESEADLSTALSNIHAEFRANSGSIGLETRSSILRALHTLKGCAGLFHLHEIHRFAHQAETELIANPDKAPEEVTRLVLKMRTVLVDTVAKYSRFIGSDPFAQDRLVIVKEKDVLALRENISAMTTSGARNQFLLPAFDRSLLFQNIDAAFSHYNLVVRQAADKLGKNVGDIKFVGGDLRLYHGPLRALFGTCIHAFRNAVDHGLETPDERQNAGKPESGNIVVTFKQAVENAELTIEINDDGRGISEAAVREKLRSMNPGHPLVNAKYEDLIQVLFESGFSTKNFVTDLSGRGVGLDAIRFEAERLGGRAWLTSVPGRGSTVNIRVPLALEVRPQNAA